MPYAHTTLADARTALAERLADSGLVHWGAADLDTCIIESLRIFQSLTSFYRDRASFTLTPTVAFYDLNAILPPAFYGLTLTGFHLWNSLCQTLIEPADLPYAGTEQFTQTRIVSAMDRRRNQFLVDTGCQVVRGTFPIAAGTLRYELPDVVIDVKRCAWRDAAGAVSTMYRDSEYSYTYQDRLWEGGDILPYTYSVMLTQPVTVQFLRPPVTSGTLEVLAIITPGPVDVAGTPLGIPDDYVWVVRMGALADLLAADGPSQDLPRSAYCEQLYKIGVLVASIGPSVLSVGVVVPEV